MTTSVRFRQSVLTVVLAAGTSITALAAEQSGLVNINIENVAQDIAKNINVNVSQIPVTVQAPIGVAANVCGVDANVLAKQKGAATACSAKTTNQALNQFVQKQIGGQAAGKGK